MATQPCGADESYLGDRNDLHTVIPNPEPEPGTGNREPIICVRDRPGTATADPNNGGQMGVYFEGDPATDSSRRHMERVLKGEAGEGRRRKWPLFLMALGSGGLWALWRTAAQGGARQEAAGASGTTPRKTSLNTPR